MRTRSMIPARSVGALRASWPANSPAALPQQGIRLRNASRQRPEVSGGELFLLPRGFFALLAQGLTNLMASLLDTSVGGAPPRCYLEDSTYTRVVLSSMRGL